MQCWINGPATGGIDDKIKMAIFFKKPNIPDFHHSIIPFPGQFRKPQNTSIFSVGCRNSETLERLGQAILKRYSWPKKTRKICCIGTLLCQTL
jgi:hypothetical protein